MSINTKEDLLRELNAISEKINPQHQSLQGVAVRNPHRKDGAMHKLDDDHGFAVEEVRRKLANDEEITNRDVDTVRTALQDWEQARQRNNRAARFFLNLLPILLTGPFFHLFFWGIKKAIVARKNNKIDRNLLRSDDEKVKFRWDWTKSIKPVGESFSTIKRVDQFLVDSKEFKIEKVVDEVSEKSEEEIARNARENVSSDEEEEPTASSSVAESGESVEEPAVVVVKTQYKAQHSKDDSQLNKGLQEQKPQLRRTVSVANLSNHADAEAASHPAYYMRSELQHPSDELYISNLQRFSNLDINLSWRNEKGDSYLHLLSQIEDKRVSAIARRMLKSADITQINAQNDLGQTPALLAFIKGHAELFKKLVENGADITIADNTGKSVVDYTRELLEQGICTALTDISVATVYPEKPEEVGELLPGINDLSIEDIIDPEDPAFTQDQSIRVYHKDEAVGEPSLTSQVTGWLWNKATSAVNSATSSVSSFVKTGLGFFTDPVGSFAQLYRSYSISTRTLALPTAQETMAFEGELNDEPVKIIMEQDEDHADKVMAKIFSPTGQLLGTFYNPEEMVKSMPRLIIHQKHEFLPMLEWIKEEPVKAQSSYGFFNGSYGDGPLGQDAKLPVPSMLPPIALYEDTSSEDNDASVNHGFDREFAFEAAFQKPVHDLDNVPALDDSRDFRAGI